MQFEVGMKPKPRALASQLDLFRAQFEQLLNHDHPLFQLANTIDWKRFDVAFADCYCPDVGAPAKAIRLLVAATLRNFRSRRIPGTPSPQ